MDEGTRNNPEEENLNKLDFLEFCPRKN